MRILIVGGGGREHAIAWKLARSPQAPELLAAPGNAGIASIARCLPVAASDVDALARLVNDEACDLTVVGPEVPLTLGLADRIRESGRAVFGPSMDGARLEGSKWFAKEVMARAGIPTARAWHASTRDEALRALEESGAPVVVKADGLAAGKGVIIAETHEEAVAAIDRIMTERRFGESGATLLIEEFLDGEEASILAFTDGERIAPLVPSQDHKRAFDGDGGPNTGGMGAYAPTPAVDEAMTRLVLRDVLEPTVAALREMGIDYRGVLYAGLMLTADGPKVLEFNCRFGDPETQVVLPLLDGDLAAIMMATAEGRLDPTDVRASARAAACVVMASGGYPGSYENGKRIDGLAAAAAVDDVVVFHAGTSVVGG
ncbi:phosphoribosylamine--glycine ligase, partial [bacterium]|nr:phosphoribosylamine--glycine ligase [bacterium]